MMNRGWKIILVAGLTETVWALSMDYSDGFTIWYFDILTVIFLIISTVLLAKALRTGIPVGTAYAVWTGIGASGTIIASVILGNETLTVIRAVFLTMIIAGIAGLQFLSRGDGDQRSGIN